MSDLMSCMPSGLGAGLPHQNAENDPAWYDAALETLQPTWWMNWKYDQLDHDGYVPMLWKCDLEWLAKALPTILSNPNHLYLLGNEPSRVDQSNTPPDVFAATVQMLRRETGDWAIPIALPGILWNDRGRSWLDEYIAADGPLPDVWHFHIYCYTSSQVHSIIKHMAYVYGDRPIIISEIAGAVENANADVMRGIRKALADDTVQAAAWFSAYYDKWPEPSLLTAEGELTEIGELFVAEQHAVHLPVVMG